MRLVKWLAGAGVASRRGAGELVLAGRVKVNGEYVQEPWLEVDPAINRVHVDGKSVRPPWPSVCILLHKPRGFITSRVDPKGRPTVFECLKGVKAPVQSVGRLDYDVDGVLLLTTDGSLSHRLTHPRYAIERVYRVKVRGHPDSLSLQRLSAGVELEDGMATADSVRFESRLERAAWLRLTLREGRNRLVKRMCEQVGYPVLKLHRIRFAGFTLGGLKAGKWRYLKDPELRGLRKQVGLESAS
jgi:pseudouridine synthase